MVNSSDDEIVGLADLLARRYVQRVDTYIREWQKPLDEAAQLARAPIAEPLALAAGDYKSITFAVLTSLLESNPVEAMRVWSEIKRLAAAEWESGHRSASTLGLDNDPWQRAQFLMIRAGMIQEWQPAGAIELAMVDMLATAFFSWQTWCERVTMWEGFSRPARRGDAPSDTPRQSEADALDQAVQMADRFNRLFLRTVRGLRDLRRYATVIVNSGGQVNIGDRQVNVSGDQATPAPSDAR